MSVSTDRPKPAAKVRAAGPALPALACFVIVAAAFTTVIGGANPAAAWLPTIAVLLFVVICQLFALLRR